MAVSEPDRHELYQTLESFIGKRPTDIIMALLPPTGWGDVATRRDLDGIYQRFDGIERELDGIKLALLVGGLLSSCLESERMRTCQRILTYTRGR